MGIKTRFRNPKKQKSKKSITTIKNLKDKRIIIPQLFRISIVIVLVIILIFSAYTAYAKDQEPKTTEITITKLKYSISSNFDYTAYLKNNTVYSARRTITPRDNLAIFRNIVDHINGSFTYTLSTDKTMTNISGYYNIKAQIQTDIYTKTYTLQTGQINSTTMLLKFPIEYEFYENINKAIEAETDITASNPTLIITCSLSLSAKTSEGDIFKTINPSLNIPLNTKTIEISGTERNSNSGTLTEKQTINHPEVIEERNKWSTFSYIIIVLIIVSIIITKSDVKKPSIEKTVKKILKKYGEWIVEVEKPIKNVPFSEVINCKKINDLMKISEEIGKPIIHVQQEKNIHTFYILDNSIHYQYIIKQNQEDQ